MMRLLGLAAIGLAVACTPAQAQKSKDTLRVGAYQPISLIDYFYSSGPEETLATRMVYDVLVHYDVDKREYVGGLAESWKRIDDLTMEFKLRQGVKFHDGQPMTMDDVEYSFNFMMDPKANYRFQVTRVNWLPEKGAFERIDDRTFRIRSAEPMAVFLGKLTNFPPVVPKHIHSKLEKKQAFGSTNAVGTGPMRVAEFSTSTGVTLVKNPDYKHGNAGKPAVRISRVRIDPVPDHQTQMARLIRGEQDLMFNVDKDQAEELAKNKDFRVDVQDAVSFNWVTFDVQGRSGAKMFADKRVRLALLHAIDRKNLRNLVHPAVANEPPLEVVCHPKILHCAWSVKAPEYDPAKAKKLLAEAGYPNGFDTTILTWGEAKDTAEAVAGMWRKVGVRAGVDSATFGAFIKKRAEGVPTMVTLWDNSVGQPDIDNTAEYFFLPGPRNYNKDAELQKLAVAGRTELDPKKRTEIYRRMFDKSSSEAYLMPLHRIPAVVVHHKDVKLLGGHLHPKGFEINRVAWN